MPHATASDGVRLYYEEAGSGTPVIFVHELAGDHLSWEPQMRFFSRRYRCVAYNARGYVPSDVPEDVASYSQERARDDVIAVLDHLNIDRAHVVGLSMGGFATLHVGLAYPDRARSLVVAGCGYGAQPGDEESFRAECAAAAQRFETEGAAAAMKYAEGPTRIRFRDKDPRGWQAASVAFASRPLAGVARTLRGVQSRRPLLYQLVEPMRRLDVPTLVMTGDEDDPCLEAAILLKRNIARAGLVVIPRAGHAINVEEPDAFNAAVAEFLAAVDAGRWERRDPRSMAHGILGFDDK